jgi:hypothetical protein
MKAPATLDDLLDLEEIRRLKTRYIYALDGQDYAELRSLFLGDAPIDIDGVLFDVDGLIAMHARVFSDHRAIHRISGPLIDLLGNGEARGQWTFASVIAGTVNTVRETGYYHDTYRKIEAKGWRIASMVINYKLVFRETDDPVPYPPEIIIPAD